MKIELSKEKKYRLKFRYSTALNSVHDSPWLNSPDACAQWLNELFQKSSVVRTVLFDAWVEEGIPVTEISYSSGGSCWRHGGLSETGRKERAR